MMVMEMVANGGATRLRLLLLICMACLSNGIGQKGFVSIDCGSDRNYTDSSTGIFWTTDAAYTTTGKNVPVNVKDAPSAAILNQRQVGTARLFNDTFKFKRNCYTLSVETAKTYLLRATFYIGNITAIENRFNVYVDSNLWIKADWSDSGQDTFISHYSEVIYSPAGSTLSVCLQGRSLISALELRPISTGMYASSIGTMHESYLQLYARVNCGPSKNGTTQLWRYKDDPYDRIWTPFDQVAGGVNNFTHISNANISKLFGEDPNLPPSVVMQDAWLDYNSSILTTLFNTEDEGHQPLGQMYIATYFQELDQNASATNVRGMTFYLNNQSITSFNTSPNPFEIYTKANVKDATLNLSFVQAEWSHLNPILNAFELYLILNYSKVVTSREDAMVVDVSKEEPCISCIVSTVIALHHLQASSNLEDWNGDPCVPFPFDWLNCTADEDSPRITNLFLKNIGIQGTIPDDINLTALASLDLSYNSFEGSIHNFGNLVNLSFMDLSYNHFQGNIPNMSNCVNLQKMNLSWNDFDGIIPDFSHLKNLQLMDLSYNNLEGIISNMNNCVNLQVIDFSNNNLSRQIPQVLGTTWDLFQLTLDYNNLSGPIPTSMTQKQGLDFTYSNNHFLTPNSPSLNGPSPSPNDGPSPTPNGPSSFERNKTNGSDGILINVGIYVVSLVVLAIVIGVVWVIWTRKRRARSRIIKAIGKAENKVLVEGTFKKNALASSLAFVTLQEVSDATKNFSRKLGEGSFGPVYHGELLDGRQVAVKVRKTNSRQGAAEFFNEVELLSRIHHRNLVSLVGYCDEENQQILIYVYMPNGTLREHLNGEESRKHLDWSTRLEIALYSATGLEYLHEGCQPRIIHRDVKSSNILLDGNMVAKVADFGISKEALDGQTSGIDTVLKGTFGYLDPAYFASQRVTHKSDVYSFGVVLLEIISGRRPILEEFPGGPSISLIEWVLGEVNKENTANIIDPSLEGKFKESSLMNILSVAVSCIDPLTVKRPTMTQVVRALTEAVEQEMCCNDNDRHTNDNHTNTLEDTNGEQVSPILFLGNLPGINVTHSTILSTSYIDGSG